MEKEGVTGSSSEEASGKGRVGDDVNLMDLSTKQ